MIKSYTESGGTTLSTDWSKIGQGKLCFLHGTRSAVELMSRIDQSASARGDGGEEVLIDITGEGERGQQKRESYDSQPRASSWQSRKGTSIDQSRDYLA
jgi:hypothetical protein